MAKGQDKRSSGEKTKAQSTLKEKRGAEAGQNGKAPRSADLFGDTR